MVREVNVARMVQRRSRASLTLLAALMVIVGALSTGVSHAEASELTPLRVAVKAELEAHIVAAADAHDLTVLGRLTADSNIWLVEALRDDVANSEAEIDLIISQLQTSPGIDWAVPAQRSVDGQHFFAWTAPDFMNFDAQHFFAWTNGSEVTPALGIDVIGFAQLDAAHQSATGDGVVVAVLDTGFEVDHPLLASRLVPGIDLVDGDNDVSDAPDGVDSDNDGSVDESYGHGTYVAGVIAQIAPGAAILPIRVLDSDGRGELYAVIDGIDQAVGQGADVINISFGTSDDDGALAKAIDQAESQGVVVIAAAGNQASTARQFPAAYPNVVGVAPFDPFRNEVASFSNLSDWVDVSALGVEVFSSAPGRSYRSFSGSSIATPVVAAQAALVLEANPAMTPADVRTRIRTTAAFPPGSEIRKTRYGVVDLNASLQLAANEPEGFEIGLQSEDSCTVRDDQVVVSTSADVTWVRRGRRSVFVAHQAGLSANGELVFVDPQFDPDGTYSVAGWRDGQRILMQCQPELSGLPVASIGLVKSVEGFDANVAPGPEFHVGDVVEITYDVSNDGNVDLVDVVVDDAWLGVISCPQDTLAVGETFQCVTTETLDEIFTFFSPVFMEAQARGSFQSEVVRDDDPINFTVVEPLGIVECGFSARAGVVSVITDQNPAFLNAEYLVRQGGESTPSLILSADDARLRLDFRGEFYELAWFGLPGFTSFEVTITPMFDSGSSEPAKTGATTLCNRGSSPIALDIDQSGAVERIDATVEFDFAGDGTVETPSEWFAPSEGILFDSTIDGPLTGEHLFGDQAGQFRDGFAKLALRDVNNDGMVSGAELNGLALWTDLNTNGVLDAGETLNLTATGIVSLSTSHTNYLSTATMADGSTMITEDLWFPITEAAPVADEPNVLRNLGISLAAAAIAAAAFVIARRANRRRQLDNELNQILNNEPVKA